MFASFTAQRYTKFNDLYQLGINYKDVFLEPLASNVKSWIVSKKFNMTEFRELLGTDSIAKHIKPEYCDSTTAEMAYILNYVDKTRFTGDWTPDADTDVKLYHSLNDDIVAPENSQMMFEWLVSNNSATSSSLILLPSWRQTSWLQRCAMAIREDCSCIPCSRA